MDSVSHFQALCKRHTHLIREWQIATIGKTVVYEWWTWRCNSKRVGGGLMLLVGLSLMRANVLLLL